MMGKPRSWCALWLAIAIGLGASSSALAQDQPSGDAKAQAQQHYEAGLQAYNVGDFDEAIREWKTAYRLHSAPDFQFNIAQAYRAKRDYQNAVFFFNAFLRERPDAPNVAEVVALRDEMERLLAEQRVTANPDDPPEQPDGGETAGAEGSVTARADLGPPGGSLKLAGLITGGAGVALVTAGIVLSLSAASTADELEQASRNGDPWSQELEDKESAGKRNGTLGVAFIAGGAAAVVAGAVSYTLGWRRDRARSSVAVVPAPGGGGTVGVRIEF